MTVDEINDLNKSELIDLLDEEEIEYPKKAKVAELRKLAVANLADEEDDEEEVEEDDDLELEDLDEDEEEAPKAKTKSKTTKTKKKAKPKIEFGARQLAEYISGEIGKNYDPRQLRVLLRKMAKDGRIQRDPESDARSRYSWGGADDPEVATILEAVRGGEVENASKESLDKLKASKAKKGKAAKGKKKKAPEPEPEDDDEELDEDELEDLD